jgi:hypothetical protein
VIIGGWCYWPHGLVVSRDGPGMGCPFFRVFCVSSVRSLQIHQSRNCVNYADILCYRKDVVLPDIEKARSPIPKYSLDECADEPPAAEPLIMTTDDGSVALPPPEIIIPLLRGVPANELRVFDTSTLKLPKSLYCVPRHTFSLQHCILAGFLRPNDCLECCGQYGWITKGAKYY